MSSSDFFAESNSPGFCYDDQTIFLLIDTCRSLDSWFVKNRFLLSIKCPDLRIADEIADLKRELEQKQLLLADLKQKVRGYVAEIDAVVGKGRVRTKTVKKASRLIIERFYGKLTRDFHTNKRVTQDIAIIGSKRLRNRIAGFVTHLMKRIDAGPIRGISIKLQEEERERRDNYQPDVSILETMVYEPDATSTAMINSLTDKKRSVQSKKH